MTAAEALRGSTKPRHGFLRTKGADSEPSAAASPGDRSRRRGCSWIIVLVVALIAVAVVTGSGFFAQGSGGAEDALLTTGGAAVGKAGKGFRRQWNTATTKPEDEDPVDDAEDKAPDSGDDVGGGGAGAAVAMDHVDKRKAMFAMLMKDKEAAHEQQAQSRLRGAAETGLTGPGGAAADDPAAERAELEANAHNIMKEERSSFGHGPPHDEDLSLKQQLPGVDATEEKEASEDAQAGEQAVADGEKGELEAGKEPPVDADAAAEAETGAGDAAAGEAEPAEAQNDVAGDTVDEADKEAETEPAEGEPVKPSRALGILQRFQRGTSATTLPSDAQAGPAEKGDGEVEEAADAAEAAAETEDAGGEASSADTPKTVDGEPVVGGGSKGLGAADADAEEPEKDAGDEAGEGAEPKKDLGDDAGDGSEEPTKEEDAEPRDKEETADRDGEAEAGESQVGGESVQLAATAEKAADADSADDSAVDGADEGKPEAEGDVDDGERKREGEAEGEADGEREVEGDGQEGGPKDGILGALDNAADKPDRATGILGALNAAVDKVDHAAGAALLGRRHRRVDEEQGRNAATAALDEPVQADGDADTEPPHNAEAEDTSVRMMELKPINGHEDVQKPLGRTRHALKRGLKKRPLTRAKRVKPRNRDSSAMPAPDGIELPAEDVVGDDPLALGKIGDSEHSSPRRTGTRASKTRRRKSKQQAALDAAVRKKELRLKRRKQRVGSEAAEEMEDRQELPKGRRRALPKKALHRRGRNEKVALHEEGEASEPHALVERAEDGAGGEVEEKLPLLEPGGEGFTQATDVGDPLSTGAGAAAAAAAAGRSADGANPDNIPGRKTAICLVGGVRELDLSGTSLKEHLLPAFEDADVFVTTMLDKNTHKLSVLKGVKLVAVKVVSLKALLAREGQIDQGVVDDLVADGTPSGKEALLHYYQLVESCFNLIEMYETKKDVMYEQVLWTRIDTFWSSRPHLSRAHSEAYYAPEGSSGTDFGGLNDRLGLGPREYSKAAMMRYTALKDLHAKGLERLGSEGIYKAQLEAAGVPVERLDLPFCIPTHRTFPFPPVDAPVAPMGTPAARNGIYCRPCKPLAEADVALRSSWDMDVFCDASTEWEDSWESIFDQMAGPEAAEVRRHVRDRSQEQCLVDVRALLKPLGTQYRGVPAARICKQAFLKDAPSF
eukprot:SM000118S25568  [mRNA]  locus=s118:16151:22785:- [translate_table: standard]